MGENGARAPNRVHSQHDTPGALHKRTAPRYILWTMTTRRDFQATLPRCPGCEELKLVVSERDQGQWASLLVDPAIGQEASELLASGFDDAKRLAIRRAMAYRHESAQLDANEETGRIE